MSVRNLRAVKASLITLLVFASTYGCVIQAADIAGDCGDLEGNSLLIQEKTILGTAGYHNLDVALFMDSYLDNYKSRLNELIRAREDELLSDNRLQNGDDDTQRHLFAGKRHPAPVVRIEQDRSRESGAPSPWCTELDGALMELEKSTREFKLYRLHTKLVENYRNNMLLRLFIQDIKGCEDFAEKASDYYIEGPGAKSERGSINLIARSYQHCLSEAADQQKHTETNSSGPGKQQQRDRTFNVFGS